MGKGWSCVQLLAAHTSFAVELKLSRLIFSKHPKSGEVRTRYSSDGSRAHAMAHSNSCGCAAIALGLASPVDIDIDIAIDR